MSRVAYEFRPKLINVACLIFKRQTKLHWQNKMQILESILFFLISITVSGMMNNQLDVSTILIITLFSIILSSDALLQDDFKKGILEQFLILGVNLEIILFIKVIAHTIIISIPLILVISLTQYFLNINVIIELMIPGIFFMIFSAVLVCLLANSLCLSYNKNIFITILAMPLLIPTMIFTEMSFNDIDYLMTLLSILCFEIPLFITASSSIIKETIKS